MICDFLHFFEKQKNILPEAGYFCSQKFAIEFYVNRMKSFF